MSSTSPSLGMCTPTRLSMRYRNSSPRPAASSVQSAYGASDPMVSAALAGDAARRAGVRAPAALFFTLSLPVLQVALHGDRLLFGGGERAESSSHHVLHRRLPFRLGKGVAGGPAGIEQILILERIVVGGGVRVGLRHAHEAAVDVGLPVGLPLPDVHETIGLAHAERGQGGDAATRELDGRRVAEVLRREPRYVLRSG